MQDHDYQILASFAVHKFDLDNAHRGMRYCGVVIHQSQGDLFNQWDLVRVAHHEHPYTQMFPLLLNSTYMKTTVSHHRNTPFRPASQH